MTHPYVADQAAGQGRFEREAQVAMRLRHRNIAGVCRAGIVGRQLFLDMELVGGVSLASLIDRLADEPSPRGLFWRVNDDVLRGLAHAHDLTSADGRPLGVVHRDLSPSNILIGFDGIARIIDFGMVRACVGAFQTKLGHIGGTPQYMSPEQARGRPVDLRSDLYSWGAVMFEVMTGERLVKGDNLRAHLQAVLDDPAPRLSKVDRSLPRGLDAIMRSMLSKSPDERPGSAERARRAFEAVVGQSMWSEAEVGALVRRVFADRYDVFERLKNHDTRPIENILHMTAPTVVQTLPVTEPAAAPTIGEASFPG